MTTPGPSKDRASKYPPRLKKRYEPPRVHSLTSDDLIDAIGPAQALSSGAIEPPHPGPGGGGHRRGRRHH